MALNPARDAQVWRPSPRARNAHERTASCKRSRRCRCRPRELNGQCSRPPCRDRTPHCKTRFPMIITCETCREPFTPRRRSARFCSDRCRVAAYRARAAVTGATPRSATNDAVKAPPRSVVPAVTLRAPPGVVPDAVHRGMFRIRLPGGGLSAMVNLTRARDALRTLRESRVCVSYSASAATGDADRRLPIVRGCVAP